MLSKYKIHQKSIAYFNKIMKIWKQNLIINAFDSVPFYSDYDNSSPCKKLSKMTYNMTTNLEKILVFGIIEKQVLQF